jgi:hypothetical protein
MFIWRVGNQYFPVNLFEVIPALVAFIAIGCTWNSISWDKNKRFKGNNIKKIISMGITAISVISYFVLVITTWNVFSVVKILSFLGICFSIYKISLWRKNGLFILCCVLVVTAVGFFVYLNEYNKNVRYLSEEPRKESYDFRIDYIGKDLVLYQNGVFNIIYYNGENHVSSFDVPNNEYTRICDEPEGQDYYFIRQILEKWTLYDFNTSPPTELLRDVLGPVWNELHVPRNKIKGF